MDRHWIVMTMRIGDSRGCFKKGESKIANSHLIFQFIGRVIYRVRIKIFQKDLDLTADQFFISRSDYGIWLMWLKL